MATSYDVDRWIAELKAAGWTPETPTRWRDPHGNLHVGPAGAYRTLKAFTACAFVLECVIREAEEKPMDEYPKGDVPLPGSLMFRKPTPLYPSPCCGAESRPLDGLAIMRCGQCGQRWKP